MTTVLVTGATGFIGRSMCRELQLHGHAVRGTARNATGESGYPISVVGEIGPDTDWRAALAGCAAVIHLAARVHVMRANADDFHRVNVEGSENLARQAAQAGVRRFLFVSSVKVNGENSAQHAFVETDAPKPLDAYGASKAESERRLGIVSADSGMELVTVRPPLVYGPGVKANFLRLLRVVDAGMPLPLLSIDNRRSLIYVGNLVHALRACLVQPTAQNSTFFVSDDQDVSTPQLVLQIGEALGKKPLLFPFPPALMRGAGKLTGRAQEVDRLTGSLQVDISSIKTALGWRPPFSLRQGLTQTASWYRTHYG